MGVLAQRVGLNKRLGHAVYVSVCHQIRLLMLCAAFLHLNLQMD